MAIIGTFGSFTCARLAIYASQASLNVTGNNIANINTTGYTRQRMDLLSLNSTGWGEYRSSGNLDIGYGVLCDSVSQLRDPYLDIRYRDEQANLGALEAKVNALNSLQSHLDEVGKGENALGKGFGVIISQLEEVFKTLENLKQRVGSDPYDNQVRAACKTLTDLLNNAAKQVETVRDNKVDELKQDVKQVNLYLQEIRGLNQEIRQAGICGDSALELRDARNLAIDKLSKYMKIDVKYSNEYIDQYTTVEKLTISLADTQPPIDLVNGIYATQLEMPETVPMPNPNYDPTDEKGMMYVSKEGGYTDTERLAALVRNTFDSYESTTKKGSAVKLQTTQSGTQNPVALAAPTEGYSYMKADGTLTDDVNEAAYVMNQGSDRREKPYLTAVTDSTGKITGYRSTSDKRLAARAVVVTDPTNVPADTQYIGKNNALTDKVDDSLVLTTTKKDSWAMVDPSTVPADMAGYKYVKKDGTLTDDPDDPDIELVPNPDAKTKADKPYLKADTDKNGNTIYVPTADKTEAAKAVVVDPALSEDDAPTDVQYISQISTAVSQPYMKDVHEEVDLMADAMTTTDENDDERILLDLNRYKDQPAEALKYGIYLDKDGKETTDVSQARLMENPDDDTKADLPYLKWDEGAKAYVPTDQEAEASKTLVLKSDIDPTEVSGGIGYIIQDKTTVTGNPDGSETIKYEVKQPLDDVVTVTVQDAGISTTRPLVYLEKPEPTSDYTYVDKETKEETDDPNKAALIANPDRETQKYFPYLAWGTDASGNSTGELVPTADPTKAAKAIVVKSGENPTDVTYVSSKASQVPTADPQEAAKQLNPKYTITDPDDPNKPYSPGMKYLDEDGKPTDDPTKAKQIPSFSTNAAHADLNSYLLGLDALKDGEGRYMRDKYGIEIKEKTELLDTTLVDGSLQAMREFLTEEGEFASEYDIGVDAKASTKRGVRYYQSVLDSWAQKFAVTFNEANQLPPATIYKMDDTGRFLDLDGRPIEAKDKDGFTVDITGIKEIAVQDGDDCSYSAEEIKILREQGKVWTAGAMNLEKVFKTAADGRTLVDSDGKTILNKDGKPMDAFDSTTCDLDTLWEKGVLLSNADMSQVFENNGGTFTHKDAATDPNKVVTIEKDLSDYSAVEIDTLRKSGVLTKEYAYYDGGVLFSNRGDSNDPTGITAKNISVSYSWQNGEVRILNTKQPDYVDTSGNIQTSTTANDNIIHMLDLFDRQLTYEAKDTVSDSAADRYFFKGSFEEMFTNISGTLAADAMPSNALYEASNILSLDLDNQRMSVSGVDLNEEATNMMQFQKSYSAACRLLTTLDSMLDKLINGTAV